MSSLPAPVADIVELHCHPRADDGMALETTGRLYPSDTRQEPV